MKEKISVVGAHIRKSKLSKTPLASNIVIVCSDTMFGC